MIFLVEIDTEEFYNYAREIGGKTLRACLRDEMIKQGREVSEERMHWDTLSEQDQSLDIQIFRELITSFIRAEGIPSPTISSPMHKVLMEIGLSSREMDTVAFSMVYRKFFGHGVSQHQLYEVVAKLVDHLDFLETSNQENS